MIMDEEQRLRTIQDLKNEIAIVNERKIMLALTIDYNSDKTDFEIATLKEELNEVLKELNILMKQLRALQVKYTISYTAQIFDFDEVKRPQNYVEDFYLQSECNIDTKLNGWEYYMGNTKVNYLLQEIHNTISILRSSDFVITGIKR
jgi:hypothetical protein